MTTEFLSFVANAVLVGVGVKIETKIATVTEESTGGKDDTPPREYNLELLRSPEKALLLTADADHYDRGLQVIGAGWGRTGTTSLKAALSILTGGACYHMKDNIQNGHSSLWLHAQTHGRTEEEWREFFRLYGACVDVPASMFWEQLLAAHPDAKVVLSVRSPQSWYRSCCETIFPMQPGNPAQPWGIYLFQVLMPVGPGRAFRAMMQAVWNDSEMGFQGAYESMSVSVYACLCLCPYLVHPSFSPANNPPPLKTHQQPNQCRRLRRRERDEEVRSVERRGGPPLPCEQATALRGQRRLDPAVRLPRPACA